MKKTSASNSHKVKEAAARYDLREVEIKLSSIRRRIPFDSKKLAAFCKRWKILEFSFFGSILREDFRPDSDVDVLVSFSPDAGWSLLDLIAMQEELQTMFNRKVDLIEKEAIRNPYRRHSILTGREVLYAAKRS
jgi:predicted nucleotidyltransferase